MPLRTLATFYLVVCLSCGRQTNNAPRALYGRWVLDSTSGKGGKIISGGPREHTEFTLRPDNTFNFQWSDFDVSNSFNGAYDYKEPDDARPATLTFLMYSQEKKDSIIHKDTLAVLEVTDSFLRTEEKESYMTPDSILITQKRINIYRKITNKK